MKNGRQRPNPTRSSSSPGRVGGLGIFTSSSSRTDRRSLALARISRKPAIASTTKLVTALTSRSIINGNPIITVTNETAAVKGARAGLKTGEQFMFDDLMKAMLIRSANDAASAIAVASAGSRDAFIAAMNAWCRDHNLKKSHFADPAGLSPDSVSTPLELAAITKEFFENKEFNAITGMDSYTLTSLAGRSIPLKGLNVLHAVMPENELSVRGKTGFTAKAKFCFAGIVASKKGKWLMVVTGAENTWRETYMLIKFCEGDLELPK